MEESSFSSPDECVSALSVNFTAETVRSGAPVCDTFAANNPRAMHLTLHPAAERLRTFMETLPQRFDREGTTIHAGRNTLKAFDSGDGRIVIKRFRQPDPFHAVVYTFFRRSKAQRAYEHALRLRELGIDTPAPIAWITCRHHGLLAESYYVCRYSDHTPLSEATTRFPDTAAQKVLEEFARFAAELHAKGIEHRDFNHGNILWKAGTAKEPIRFQLIDINRMRFARHALTPRRCMINLRRLACPATAFLFILDRYADTRRWDLNDTLLQGTFFRLLFGRNRARRKRFKERIDIRRHGKSGLKI